MESVKKELDADRPSLVRRIVGEHSHSEVGAAVWRQCSLLLASFLAVRALCKEGKRHYQEADFQLSKIIAFLCSSSGK